MEPEQPTTPRRRRSGSEKRQRMNPFPVRFNRGERAIVDAAAERAGLKLGSYIRSRALDAPTTRARKQVPVDYAALAAALRAFTKAAVNLNQIARHLNTFGFPVPPELAALATQLDASRLAIMAAMGRA